MQTLPLQLFSLSSRRQHMYLSRTDFQGQVAATLCQTKHFLFPLSAAPSCAATLTSGKYLRREERSGACLLSMA